MLSEISTNWTFSIEEINPQNLESYQPENEFSAYVDSEKIQGLIMIRSRKPGDKFQPLGLEQGTMKLSDFFVNEKLVNAARARWPLVTTSEGEIIWIPGFRLNQNYRISDQTRKILKLSLINKE